MLLINEAKTMFIIVFTMIIIVATIIDIVFTKIGGILRRPKCIVMIWSCTNKRRMVGSAGDNRNAPTNIESTRNIIT